MGKLFFQIGIKCYKTVNPKKKKKIIIETIKNDNYKS